jgi:hypothetical protein
MNTQAIDKIRQRYDADHDCDPNTAPIHWSVMELTELVAQLILHIDDLESRVKELESDGDDYDYRAQKNFD